MWEGQKRGKGSSRRGRKTHVFWWGRRCPSQTWWPAMPQFNTQSCLNFGKSFKAAQSWGRNVFWVREGLQNFLYLRQASAEETTPCHAGVMQDNTFMQMWHWTNQGCYCPDPLLTRKEELVGGVLINGNCGCNDHVIAGFMIPRGLIRARTLAGFSLLRELVDWILW